MNEKSVEKLRKKYVSIMNMLYIPHLKWGYITLQIYDIKVFYVGRRIMMYLSKISAVIADDDVLKGTDIRKALEFNGVRNIMIVRNQAKLWEQIYHGENKIDLIVTDMQYPLEAGEAVDEEAGFKLIEKMKKEKIEIPIIVCSSVNYSIPDILGSVWYNELNDLDSNFKEVLGKLEKDN